jgi:hypothetical protein
MNAITYALKAAGVATPTQSELIWRRVKEQPGMTAKGIGMSLTSIKKSSISTLLSAMEKRGMVYTKRDAGRARKYYTDMTAYELLPLPKPLPKVTPPAKIEVEYCQSSPLVVTPPKAFNLDDLTVREARALYEQLHKMFGGKS